MRALSNLTNNPFAGPNGPKMSLKEFWGPNGPKIKTFYYGPGLKNEPWAGQKKMGVLTSLPRIIKFYVVNRHKAIKIFALD